MLNVSLKIPRLLRGLLTRPERNLVKMFGMHKVNSQLPRIIKAMIKRNYRSRQNADGSSWAGWTKATAKLRKRGIARLKPRKLARYSSTIMKASGDYYRSLQNLDFGQMKLTSTDQLWHSNNSAILYISTDEIPALWNEFGRDGTSGAINSTDRVEPRQMLYFDSEASSDIISIVTGSLDTYWR